MIGDEAWYRSTFIPTVAQRGTAVFEARGASSAASAANARLDSREWRPLAVRKPQNHDFSLELTRVIEPKGGPGVELATLEDAARFMGKMRPFRQRGPHWDYAAEPVLIAAATGEEADIERATAQMERVRRRFRQVDKYNLGGRPRRPARSPHLMLQPLAGACNAHRTISSANSRQWSAPATSL
jgi:hypothetical protein